MTDPPGLDLDRLATHLGGAAKLTGSVISGGRSNLTYRVSDGTTTWVVRRPPLGHVLPSAHDMAREYRIISALAGGPVPVPRPLLLCADSDVIGAPFYVMEYVDGAVLRGPEDHARLTTDTAPACGGILVDVLLDLHRVDHAAVGLGDFGRPEGYLERQVARWYGQWQRSQTRELPLLDTVAKDLAAGVPAAGEPGIVHGDYRLDNVMFDAAFSRIVAVLDWEMATIGDPLADVGLLVVYTELAERGVSEINAGLDPALGFPAAGELLARYAGGTHRGLDELPWYVALGYYKLAIISEGIHARYLQGKTVGEGFDAIGPTVPALVEYAAGALRGETNW